MLSTFRPYWVHTPLEFPVFTDTKIMMMPVTLGSLSGVPVQYVPLLKELYSMVESRFIGAIGYLTIDEKHFDQEETHRREGWHVDGHYKGRCGAWGGGGSWGSTGNGMIVISNVVGCEAIAADIQTQVGDEGEIDPEGLKGVVKTPFKANIPYWVDGSCIHRSLKQPKGTKRQFLRLSMPNNGPWFEGYTKNPNGIKPTGDILPRREFM